MISTELKTLFQQIGNNQYTNEILSLQELDLDNEAIKELSLVLQKNTYIKSIDLSNNQFNGDAVKFLCDINVKSLNVSGNLIGNEAYLFSKNQHIEEIFLEECEITDFAASEVLKNPKLKKINLSSNGLGDEALKTLPNSSPLEVIILNQNKITYKGAQFLGKHENIQVINLGTNQIGDSGAKLLAQSNKVIKLYLDQNGITKEGFLNLCTSTSIQELSLFNNDICFDESDDLPKNASFVRLNLGYNQINGKCQKILQGLVSILTLQKIDFTNNNIDDRGAKILFKDKPSYLQVILEGNPGKKIPLTYSSTVQKVKKQSSAEARIAETPFIQLVIQMSTMPEEEMKVVKKLLADNGFEIKPFKKSKLDYKL